MTVKIMKIDKSWWYSSYRKCFRIAKPHGDTYKCTDSACNNIGAPSSRYIVITVTLSFTYRFADLFLHVMVDTSWSLLSGMKLVTLSLSYLDG
jgi:hypothetical protein